MAEKETGATERFRKCVFLNNLVSGRNDTFIKGERRYVEGMN